MGRRGWLWTWLFAVLSVSGSSQAQSASAPPPSQGAPPSVGQLPPVPPSASAEPSNAAPAGASPSAFGSAPMYPAPPSAYPTYPPAPPAVTNVGCFPACRTGFLCYQSQCISACNPPCGANEICTASAECTIAPGASNGAFASDDGESESDEGSAYGPHRHALRGSIGLDVTFFTQSEVPSTTGGTTNLTTTVVVPVLRAVIPTGEWTIEPDLPLLYYHVSFPPELSAFPPVTPQTDFGFAGDSGFVVGNPTLTLKHHWRRRGMDVHFGPGIAFPLLQVDEADPHAFAAFQGYGAALATRGAWNFWWYAPNTFTLFAPVGVRYVSRGGLDIGADGALAGFFHGGSGNRDPIAGGQIGGHVGYASSALETGVHLRGVRLPGDSGDDLFQASLEPYVRGFLGQAFIGAGFVLNLDKPLGPLLDTGSGWGLRLEGGARF